MTSHTCSRVAWSSTFHELQTTDGFGDNEVLRLAATLERASEHPLAEAIVAGALERGIALGDAGRSGLPITRWTARPMMGDGCF